jgi:hypothetical protein
MCVCVCVCVCGKSLSIVSFTMVHLTIQTRISRGQRGAQAAFVTQKNGADSKLRCSLIQMCACVFVHCFVTANASYSHDN